MKRIRTYTIYGFNEGTLSTYGTNIPAENVTAHLIGAEESGWLNLMVNEDAHE